MAALALRDLAKANGSPPAHGPFEFCDDAASTFTMNFCSGYASEVEDNRRNRYYNSLKSAMTPEQQAAFEKLFVAQTVYIKAHASEVDQGGTIRGIRTIGSQNILKDLFHAEIVHFERRKWPILSDNQITMADAALHREYEKTLQQLRTQTTKEVDQGAVGPSQPTIFPAWKERARTTAMPGSHLRVSAILLPSQSSVPKSPSTDTVC